MYFAAQPSQETRRIAATEQVFPGGLNISDGQVQALGRARRCRGDVLPEITEHAEKSPIDELSPQTLRMAQAEFFIFSSRVIRRLDLL